MEQKNEQFKQFSCECGKRFGTRSDLDKHRQSCATAQASGAMTSEGGPVRDQVRGAGSGNPKE